MNHHQELILPKLHYKLIEFARSLDCTWIGAVYVDAKPHCKIWDCHNNVLNYTTWYGGERVLGYYFLQHAHMDHMIAILHSVVKTTTGNLIDITPFDDQREYNIFAICKNQTPDYTCQEISSYKIGDAKMDVTDESFTGFSL